MMNPLLREPLTLEHVKPRLLGDRETTPGLNFIYAHMNRVFKANDLNALYIAAPGHGGPGLVANAWLEGTYSEYYPGITEDEQGCAVYIKQLMRDKLIEHQQYVREYGEDMPEVKDWQWNAEPRTQY
ncbi:MAG: hypothetical protein PSN04_02800 [Methyloprofundus sp.]|nr:hypothetical protein [Methyloprofundus sp.]